jgi:hypothetical protein
MRKGEGKGSIPRAPCLAQDESVDPPSCLYDLGASRYLMPTRLRVLSRGCVAVVSRRLRGKV